VQFLATQPHYRDHLRPVYEALPPRVRGRWIESKADLTDPAALTVVASYGDYRLTAGPAIYFEHGVGFSFGGDHPAFSGGRGKDRVALFCNTNRYVDARNRAAYPQADHHIVGCPKLDAWPSQPRPSNPRPVVAVSFHWDSKIAPETRPAFPHYRNALERLQDAGWDIIGHGHPRAWSFLGPFWDELGVEQVQDFSEVIRRADVYVADATSTLYEAAVVMPVVVLNAPWYRRDVDFGLRFWDAVPGVEVNDPRALRRQIARALNGAGEDRRRAAVKTAYPYLGHSAQRAALTIVSWLRAARRRDGGAILGGNRLTGGQGMAAPRLATERIYRTTADGRRVLIAAPGDPLPEGYVEEMSLPPIVEDKRVRAPRKSRARKSA
jgi:hypothetical protein